MNLNLITGPLSQAVGGYLQGDQQRQARDQQTALLNYQLKRQQEQDALKQQLEDRQNQLQAQHLQLQAALGGMRPQGIPSRIDPSLNAVPLPSAVTKVPSETPEASDAIPGAAQRSAELQDQDTTPGITIGDQRFGVPAPKAKPGQYKAVQNKQGIWTVIDEATGLGPDGKPVEGLTPKEAAPPHGQVRDTETGLVEIDPVTGVPTPVIDKRTGKQLKGYHPPAQPVVGSQEWKDAKAYEAGLKPPKSASGKDAAQIGIAIGQATGASPIMDAFEDDVLARKASIGPLDMEAANKVLRGGFGAASAEAYLNHANPRLLQYVKGGKAIANADRLVAARGGSQQMVNAEQLLSTVGAYPTKEQIGQARTMRKATLSGLAAAQATAGGAPETSPLTRRNTVRTQDEYNYLRDKGWSKSKIQATYDIDPSVEQR